MSCVKCHHSDSRAFSSLAHPSLKDKHWFCNIGCGLDVKIYCVDFFLKNMHIISKIYQKNIIDIQTFSLNCLYFPFVKLWNVYKLWRFKIYTSHSFGLIVKPINYIVKPLKYNIHTVLENNSPTVINRVNLATLPLKLSHLTRIFHCRCGLWFSDWIRVRVCNYKSSVSALSDLDRYRSQPD
jgi:hypothetical protein